MSIPLADSAAIAKAYREGAAWISLDSELTLLRVRGGDARSYLQRLVSADVRRCNAEQGVPCTLMTHKGKLLGAFDLYCEGGEGEGFWLLLERAVLEQVREQLQKLVILEDVVVEEVGERVATLQGAGATPLLAQVAGLEAHALSDYGEHAVLSSPRLPGVTLLRRDRSLAGGWDCVAAEEELQKLQAEVLAAGAHEVSLEESEPYRVEGGFPRFGVDVTHDHMPPEAGFDAAISYDKGCYAGQEVVARIRTYGHVNKKLRRLWVRGDQVPSVGDKIVSERALGEVTSVAQVPAVSSDEIKIVALGYVRLKGGELGSHVRILSAAGELTAEVAPLRESLTDE